MPEAAAFDLAFRVKAIQEAKSTGDVMEVLFSCQSFEQVRKCFVAYAKQHEGAMTAADAYKNVLFGASYFAPSREAEAKLTAHLKRITKPLTKAGEGQ